MTRRHFFSKLLRPPLPGRSSVVGADHSQIGAPLRTGELLELLALFAWTAFVTAPYLNPSPELAPTGGEFLANIQTHHIWNWARSCGPCALWFGGVNGGWPAAADVNAATFHPIVAVTTLRWGVVNGSKMTLFFSFFVAAFGQWWLARVLGVGRVARLWTAAMAVVAGSLASRMNLGSIGLVLSTATAALLWPAAIAVSRTGRRRDAVLLGLAAGLLLLSGNGYIQLASAFAAPAVILLLPRARLGILRRYLLAAGIAVLLAAPVLVPFAHFLPHFAKDFDPAFKSAQPFRYVPLNLVINDRAFYSTNEFQKLPFPFMYASFIGWVPVLLALFGASIVLTRRRDSKERRAIGFLIAVALMGFWLASAGPQKLLFHLAPFPPLIRFVSGARYAPFMAGLAVPPILGLAAAGLDRFLSTRKLRIGVPRRPWSRLAVHPRWIAVIPLIAALFTAKRFASEWIDARWLPTHLSPVYDALRTPDLQWVSTPFGEHFWVEPALERGLKLAHDVYLTWHWRDHPSPDPVLSVTHEDQQIAGMRLFKSVAGVKIFEAPPGREYAAVEHSDGQRTVCRAGGLGGNIDVVCDLTRPGLLVVRENAWTGWKAGTSDGALELVPGQWLAVTLPDGRHVVRFRYRPWDFPLGLVLSAIGALVCAISLRKDREDRLPQRPLEPSTGKEERRADREQRELATDVSRENTVEERDAGHDQSRELERSREEIHAGRGVMERRTRRP